MDQGTPVGPRVGHRSTPRPHTAKEPDRRYGEPALVVPGMVLLAAGGIFAGYYWLHLIPDGSLRAPAFAVALAVVPVTFALTAYGPPGVLRALARATAVVLPVLAVVGLATHGAVWTRALGATSLVLAASLLALAAVSEHARRPRS